MPSCSVPIDILGTSACHVLESVVFVLGCWFMSPGTSVATRREGGQSGSPGAAVPPDDPPVAWAMAMGEVRIEFETDVRTDTSISYVSSALPKGPRDPDAPPSVLTWLQGRYHYCYYCPWH